MRDPPGQRMTRAASPQRVRPVVPAADGPAQAPPEAQPARAPLECFGCSVAATRPKPSAATAVRGRRPGSGWPHRPAGPRSWPSREPWRWPAWSWPSPPWGPLSRTPHRRRPRAGPRARPPPRRRHLVRGRRGRPEPVPAGVLRHRVRGVARRERGHVPGIRGLRGTVEPGGGPGPDPADAAARLVGAHAGRVADPGPEHDDGDAGPDHVDGDAVPEHAVPDPLVPAAHADADPFVPAADADPGQAAGLLAAPDPGPRGNPRDRQGLSAAVGSGVEPHPMTTGGRRHNRLS